MLRRRMNDRISNMNDTTKSVYTSLGIVFSVGAICLGLKVRERTDIGGIQATTRVAGSSRMLASRSNDVNVPAADYFYELSQKLKEQYVEPVADDQKLATGAIRGMIASLGDPDSTFMDKDQFKAFLNARTGKYEGIGADLVLSTENHTTAPKTPGQPSAGEISPEEALVLVREIPRVQVVNVVPGGPADKAGVQVGDTVDSIDGHWVVQSDLIRKFRIASKKFNEKKMSRADLEALRTEIRIKFERAIFPMKAKDKLFMGKAGDVNVVWNRNGTMRKTKITKGVSSLSGFTVKNDTVMLPFQEGSAAQLKSAIQGKSSVTIDLRHNTLGDIQSMKQCLEVIAPKGEYGYFVTKRHDTPTPLNVLKGNSNPPKIHVLTDKSTRGMAEAFALALDSKGLIPHDKFLLGGDRTNRQIVQLPDGSGYTLVTSEYQAKLAKSTKSMTARKGGVK